MTPGVYGKCPHGHAWYVCSICNGDARQFVTTGIGGITQAPEQRIIAGFKSDQGKRDWLLFPFDGAEEIVKVLEFGAQKYDRDNWRKVDNAFQRYRNAAFRHMVRDALGEENDPESGLRHLAHAGCSILFALASKCPSSK